jgi:DNA mismatch repair protein MutH
VLRDDYDEIMGRIGAGGIEMLSARVGRWLQLRPKAADGAARTMAPGVDGELVATVPRGFYLRAMFTRAILARADATP